MEYNKKDMKRSIEYDLAVKKTVNAPSKYFEDNGVYFNNEYRDKLCADLKANGCFNNFNNEVNKYYEPDNKKKCKMCSIASSSRLCYLHFRGNKKIQFEEIIRNGDVCKPHLDAYDKEKNIYYECKCHEIVGHHSVNLSSQYKDLLENLFHITGLIEEKGYFKLNYEMFGIKGFKIKCGKYFDFKQFVCHIIGVMNRQNDKKPTLKYLFFKPDIECIERCEQLKSWKVEFDIIETKLFKKLKEIPVFKNGKQEQLQDVVNIEQEPICVSKIVDPFI